MLDNFGGCSCGSAVLCCAVPISTQCWHNSAFQHRCARQSTAARVCRDGLRTLWTCARSRVFQKLLSAPLPCCQRAGVAGQLTQVMSSEANACRAAAEVGAQPGSRRPVAARRCLRLPLTAAQRFGSAGIASALSCFAVAAFPSQQCTEASPAFPLRSGCIAWGCGMTRQELIPSPGSPRCCCSAVLCVLAALLLPGLLAAAELCGRWAAASGGIVQEGPWGSIPRALPGAAGCEGRRCSCATARVSALCSGCRQCCRRAFLCCWKNQGEPRGVRECGGGRSDLVLQRQ